MNFKTHNQHDSIVILYEMFYNGSKLETIVHTEKLQFILLSLRL